MSIVSRPGTLLTGLLGLVCVVGLLAAPAASEPRTIGVAGVGDDVGSADDDYTGEELRSRVESTEDPEPDVWFHGGGWGHSVGLSQYGAYAQALEGRDHEQILAHYYQGIDVVQLGEPDSVRVGLFTERESFAIEALAGDFAWVLCSPSGDCRQVGTEQSGGETWTVERRDDDAGFQLLDDEDDVVWAGGGDADRLYARHDGERVRAQNPNRGRCPDGCEYRRGVFELSANPDREGELVVVHELTSMSDYLRGLGEMPAAWPSEALAAQAIIGRTYALRQHGGSSERSCRCDIGATPASQVYLGEEVAATASGSRWVDAVEQTEGRVVTFDGALASTVYSSSHGTRSENAEDSWAFASETPYLRSVDDPWSADDRVNNPKAEWTEVLFADDFPELVAPELDRVTRIQIVDRTEGGTPRTLAVSGIDEDGERASVIYTGDCRDVAGASLVFVDDTRCGGDDRFLPSQQVARIGFPPFTDDDGSAHEYAITFAAEAAIAQGRSATEFAPGVPITRGQMAQFLDNTFDLPRGDGDGFTDTAGHRFAEAIDAVAEAGIAGGFGDDTFRPDEAVTRGQMATFLRTALDLPDGEPGRFDDVPPESTHHDSIAAIAAAEVARGCGDDRFCPGDSVTRGQMATFLYQGVQWARG